jgi:hypothetical protein
MGYNLPGGKSRFNEIIRFFAGIDNHGYHRDGEHGKHKCAQEFPEYVPIQFLHE